MVQTDDPNILPMANLMPLGLGPGIELIFDEM